MTNIRQHGSRVPGLRQRASGCDLQIVIIAVEEGFYGRRHKLRLRAQHRGHVSRHHGMRPVQRLPGSSRKAGHALLYVFLHGLRCGRLYAIVAYRSQRLRVHGASQHYKLPPPCRTGIHVQVGVCSWRSWHSVSHCSKTQRCDG